MSTDHKSLLKHGNFDFALFGSGGVDSCLKSHALKIKGGVVGRVVHAKSSDPATPSPQESGRWTRS